MQGLHENGVHSAPLTQELGSLDEGYFLTWIAIWIIALAILLPALI